MNYDSYLLLKSALVLVESTRRTTAQNDLAVALGERLRDLEKQFPSWKKMVKGRTRRQVKAEKIVFAMLAKAAPSCPPIFERA